MKTATKGLTLAQVNETAAELGFKVEFEAEDKKYCVYRLSADKCVAECDSLGEALGTVEGFEGEDPNA